MLVVIFLYFHYQQEILKIKMPPIILNMKQNTYNDHSSEFINPRLATGIALFFAYLIHTIFLIFNRLFMKILQGNWGPRQVWKEGQPIPAAEEICGKPMTTSSVGGVFLLNWRNLLTVTRQQSLSSQSLKWKGIRQQPRH